MHPPTPVLDSLSLFFFGVHLLPIFPLARVFVWIDSVRSGFTDGGRRGFGLELSRISLKDFRGAGDAAESPDDDDDVTKRQQGFQHRVRER